MSVQVTLEAVDKVLDDLRVGFQADGADLAVEAATTAGVVVRLVVTDETCAECIVAGPMLQLMIATTLRGRFPALTKVEVIDPRGAH